MPRLPARIQTDRLVLRMPRPDDAPPMFANWSQDAEVTRYLTWRPHQSVANAENFIRGSIDAWSGDVRAPFVITTREQDVPIGIIEVRFENTFISTLGYVLQRSAWNRGYMTEACTAVLDCLFALPEIWRVWAYCDVDNAASARVLEHSGMQFEGILRRAMLHPNISDAPRDVRLYARVR